MGKKKRIKAIHAEFCISKGLVQNNSILKKGNPYEIDIEKQLK